LSDGVANDVGFGDVDGSGRLVGVTEIVGVREVVINDALEVNGGSGVKVVGENEEGVEEVLGIVNPLFITEKLDVFLFLSVLVSFAVVLSVRERVDASVTLLGNKKLCTEKADATFNLLVVEL